MADSAAQQDQAKTQLASAVLDSVAENAPSSLAPYVKKITPYVLKAGELCDKASPYVEKGYEYTLKAYAYIEPYDPQDLLPALFGLVLVFFGGHFLTLIAAIEAFRMTGWDKTRTCMHDLWESYKKAKAASEKDDLVDADGDGVADVLQIDKKELLTRKLRVVMKATDPAKVSDAIAGIGAGYFGVLATLRVRFAHAVTLGVTLGDILHQLVGRYAQVPLEKAISPDYRKWVGPTLKYICKSFGISLAWMVQRLISAIHSSIRGAQMFVSNGLEYAHKKGYEIPGVQADSPVGLAVVGVLATYGFMSQIYSGFNLPFPLNILLIPLRMAEYFLMQAVGHTEE